MYPLLLFPAFVLLIVVLVKQPALRFLSHQLGKPSGWFGRVIISRALKSGNMPGARWLISSISKMHKFNNVLEFGFGPGDSIALLLQHCNSYTGIEISKTMFEMAVELNREVIEQKKAKLFLNENLSSLGLEKIGTQKFDLVYHFNVIYFWKDPLTKLKEIKTVLKENGLHCICIKTEPPVRKDGFIARNAPGLMNKESIIRALNDAGYKKIDVIENDQLHTICIAARS